MSEPGTLRCRELECIKGRVEMMATHVTHLTATEVKPRAPVLRMIGVREKRHRLANAAPQIQSSPSGSASHCARNSVFFGHQLSGLFFHMMTSFTFPIAPLRMISTVMRASMLERP